MDDPNYGLNDEAEQEILPHCWGQDLNGECLEKVAVPINYWVEITGAGWQMDVAVNGVRTTPWIYGACVNPNNASEDCRGQAGGPDVEF